jgi:uncharacterized delta-60 repeat protein
MISGKSASLCAISWLASATALASNGVYIGQDTFPNDLFIRGNLPPALALGAAGEIYYGGSTVTALDSQGTLLSGFANPFPTSGSYIYALTVRPDNVLVAFSGYFDGPRDAGTLYTINAAGVIQYSRSLGAIRQATALTAYPDNRTLIGGRFHPHSPEDWFFQRANADGTADVTLSEGELVKDVGGEHSEIIRTLRVLPDGKILAGGSTFLFPSGAFSTVLMRAMSNGDADFTFGSFGLVTIPSGAGAFDLDGAGKIYVNTNGQYIVRLNSDGTVDNSYSSPAQPANVSIDQVHFDSAGRLVLFGIITDGERRAYVARLTSTGALDTSFGTNGEASIAGEFGELNGVVNGLVTAGDKPVVVLSVPRESDPGLTVSRALAVARLNVDGSPDLSFAANQPDVDIYPDAISIPSRQVPYGTVGVISDAATVTGINSTSSVTVLTASLGTQVSANCQTAWNTGVAVTAGSSFCVRHNASTQAGASTESRLNVGGRLVTFTTVSSGTPADTTPDAFSFVDRDLVPLRTEVRSNTIGITGISGAAPIVVDNGQYSIGCSPDGWRATGTITNGQTLCVRHDSSRFYGTSVNTTVSIGGVIDIFTSTTIPADTQPDPFAFQEKTGATPGSEVISDPITIVGFNSPTTITVTGGSYSRSCDPNWTTAPDNTATDPLKICVKLTASSQPGTRTTATLTVGGVSADFAVTTAAVSSGGGGDSGGGGAFDWFSIGVLALFVRRWMRKGTLLLLGSSSIAVAADGIVITEYTVPPKRSTAMLIDAQGIIRYSAGGLLSLDAAGVRLAPQAASSGGSSDGGNDAGGGGAWDWLSLVLLAPAVLWASRRRRVESKA